MKKHTAFALHCLTFPVLMSLFPQGVRADTVDGFTGFTFNNMPYRLFIPADYNPKRSYPLVTFLHGSMGRGTDNLAQISGGNIPGSHVWTSAANQAKFPCLVLAPQCPADETWCAADWSVGSYDLDRTPVTAAMTKAIAIIDKVCVDFNIDVGQLYMTGQSMGGGGTWDAVLRYPKKFRRAAPVCGYGDPSHAKDIRHLPVWAFTGEKDTLVPARATIDMCNALRAAGSTVCILTVYPGAGHNVWGLAYAEPDFVPWMFGAKTVPLNPSPAAR